MPMDEPSDLLYRLVAHELTHLFQYDIVPTSLVRQNLPLWVFEGMSDYMIGVWRPIDLMYIRDPAVSDTVPRMSELQGYGDFSNRGHLQPRPRSVRVHGIAIGEGGGSASRRRHEEKCYRRRPVPRSVRTRRENVGSAVRSGDLLAVMSGNSRDREIDILLRSARDARSSAT